jgi:uncharacterized protein
MSSPSKPIAIDFVASYRDISESVWQACFPAPLEGRFWYETLEHCGLEDQFKFSYALLKRDGQPVGIAPCFLYDVPMSLIAPPLIALLLKGLSKLLPRVGYQRTFFVGSPCSDEGTIGLVAGVALKDLIGELASAIRTKARELGAPMIVFKDFPPGAAGAFSSLYADSEFFPMLSYPGTVIALPVPDKDAFFLSLTPMRRHNFRKKLRNSKQLLPLATRIVRNPTDQEVAEIFGLFQQTYEKGKTKFERLSLAFFQQMARQEPARFILQRDPATGEIVSFMLLFVLGERLINKFIGMDYRRAGKTYLYFRLFEAALDYAYELKAKELQSGQTGYRAKLDLGHRLVPLLNICHHENRMVNLLYKNIGQSVTWKTLDSDLALFLKAHPESDYPAPRP